jgi:hypothetical protein
VLRYAAEHDSHPASIASSSARSTLDHLGHRPIIHAATLTSYSLMVLRACDDGQGGSIAARECARHKSGNA